MANERTAEDVRVLANRFRGMLNERETQALAAVRVTEVKEVSGPAATPPGAGPVRTDGAAERYRHLEERKPESRAQLGELRPASTPEVPKQKREGLSR